MRDWSKALRIAAWAATIRRSSSKRGKRSDPSTSPFAGDHGWAGMRTFDLRVDELSVRLAGNFGQPADQRTCYGVAMRVRAMAIMDTPKLTLRVDLGKGRALGPGKVRLLEAIEKTGSISQAGRTLGMSYRRAWLLVDDMNNCFRDAVIAAQPGGIHGGGAALTPFGQQLVERYRAIEADALVATRKHLHDLESALKTPKSQRAATSIKRSVRGSSTRR